ncbi:MAG TPA: hypothetical protein VIQ11_08070, partial [Mycobacterium sp.]
RHFVGCDRACGSPGHGEVLIATRDGYRPRSVDLPSLPRPQGPPVG